MEVGIRELRDHLSRYLGMVRGGEHLLVTERGRAFARIVPFEGERVIDRLVAEGLVEPAPERSAVRPADRTRSTQPVSPLVAEQRR